MRIRSSLIAVLLVTAGTTIGAALQERVKPKGPADFNTVHAAIKKHYDAGHFGKAYTGSKELMTLIGGKRAEKIRGSLPAAPQDYEKVPYKAPKNQAMQNTMFSAMAGAVGNIIEQQYRGAGGQISVTVTADSPFLQMFKMIASNPAMLGENQELIKYGDLMAILETQGKRKTLKIMIDSSMVEAVFPNHSDDFIFAMWDQAAVTKVQGAIAN